MTGHTGNSETSGWNADNFRSGHRSESEWELTKHLSHKISKFGTVVFSPTGVGKLRTEKKTLTVFERREGRQENSHSDGAMLGAIDRCFMKKFQNIVFEKHHPGGDLPVATKSASLIVVHAVPSIHPRSTCCKSTSDSDSLPNRWFRAVIVLIDCNSLGIVGHNGDHPRIRRLKRAPVK